MPTERIQLSNHRAHFDRPGSGGRLATGARCAPGLFTEDPKPCMAFTLVNHGARRNGHRPSTDPTPLPNPRAETVGRVPVTNPGGDADRPSFAFDPLPPNCGIGQLGERRVVRR